MMILTYPKALEFKGGEKYKLVRKASTSKALTFKVKHTNLRLVLVILKILS
jgi:hypothetical protein